MKNINNLSTHEQKQKPLKTHDYPLLNNYTIGTVIGQGAYGEVKNAVHIGTGENVAVKCIEKNKLIRLKDEARIKNEINIIRKINHPNMLQAYEIIENEFYFYIITEKPEKGDLFNYICNNKRGSTQESTFFFFQIVNGIEYLHKNKIVHRDLKPENLLLTDDSIVKGIDFGLSKEYKNTKLKTICGSPCYSPPEMGKGNCYSPKPIDIWGGGVILYCMICGDLPFNDNDPYSGYQKVVRCQFTFPYFVNIHIKNLIKKIFVQNPKERITGEEIKKDTVYHMGKASFIKTFKIYQLNGELRDNVKEFIKNKVGENIKKECPSLIQCSQIDKTSAFGVYFHKFLHLTQWNQGYIPKRKIKNISQSDVDDDIKQNLFTIDSKEKDKKYSLLKGPKHNLISKLKTLQNNISLISTTDEMGKHNSIYSPRDKQSECSQFREDLESKRKSLINISTIKANHESSLTSEKKKKRLKSRNGSSLHFDSLSSKRKGKYTLKNDKEETLKTTLDVNTLFKKQFTETNDYINTVLNVKFNTISGKNASKYDNSEKELERDNYFKIIKKNVSRKYYPSGDRIPFKI